MCEVLDIPRNTYYKSLDQTISKLTQENAYQIQQPAEGLIFHSDLGAQYTSDEFTAVINAFNLTHSFSYKGSPYNNACIESFHATLKKEEVNHVQYFDYKSAKLAMFQYSVI